MGAIGFFFNLFGRIRRRDFWLFAIVMTGAYALALQPAESGFGGYSTHQVSWLQALAGNDFGFIGLIVVQIATLSVIIKRLHDRDLSGFYALALLIPVLGWLWLVYELAVREGTDGANRFGPSPKAGYRTL